MAARWILQYDKSDFYNYWNSNCKMDTTFQERYDQLINSVNGGTVPLDYTRLKTKLIKLALGSFLLQNVIIALVWSVRDSNGSAWLLPITAFLQVGWFWNKVTASWKDEQHSGVAHFSTETLPNVDVEDPKVNIKHPLAWESTESV